MKKNFLILLCLMASLSLKAQHTISGIITESKDSSRLLSGIHVYIPEFERSCYSKDGGTYILRNVGIGTVHLQFTCRGYKSVLKTISTRDSAMVIDIEMTPSADEMQEITISNNASSFSTNAVFPVDIIPVTSLRRSGNIDYISALSYRPGIDNINLGSYNRLVIRGLSTNHILFFQNGAAIQNNAWNLLEDIGMTEEGTENVEIVRGPSTILYGEHAMGGVVLFRDEKMPPSGEINGDMNFNFFNNTMGGNIDAGLKGSSRNGIFYSIRAGGKSHTSYVQGEGDKARKNIEVSDFAFHSGFYSGITKGMIGISKKWGQSRLTISYNKSENEIAASMTDSMIALLDEVTERNRKNTEPFLDHSSVLVSSENILCIKNSRLNVNLSWQRNDLQHYSDLSTFNYDIRYTTDASRNLGFIAGTQLNKQKDQGQYNSVYDLTDIGVYALLRYDVSTINFSTGIRYDIKNVKGNDLVFQEDSHLPNFSAGLAWHPTDAFSIKLNAATGFSVPLEQKYNYFLNYQPGIFSENHYMEVEKNYEADLGLGLHNKTFTLSFSGFYNRINNYFYLTYPVASDFSTIPFSGNNNPQEDVNMLGGEFSVFLHPENIKWVSLETSYDLVRGEFNASKKTLPSMPADKLTASLRFQSEKMNYMYRPFISINARDYLKQERVSANEKPGEGYLLFDLHLGGSFLWAQQTFDLTLSANNILNTGYYSQLSFLKNLSPVGVRDIGRNISLQLHVPFGIRKGK